MIEEGECRKRTPMELLRAAIGEQKCEMPCDTLHDLHEDKQRNCKDRSCSECKVDALRKAANLVEAELDALKARALPEDMEWPTVDGTPVSFGERLVGYGSDSKGYEVVGVRPSCNWVLVKAAGGDILEWDASNCTRPILAADGEPIEVGQTVWSLVSGEQLTVTSIDYGKGWTRVSKSGKKEDSFPILNARNKLTHERPDSWERLEHDAEKTVCEYFGANYDCANCPLESARCAEEVKKDIIRRAKKLAERGA